MYGATSYALGPSLGDVTVAHATVGNPIGDVVTGNLIAVVQLDEAGTATFARVTKAVIGKELATLLRGRVVNAPMITDSVRDGQFALVAEPPDAKTTTQLAAALNAR